MADIEIRLVVKGQGVENISKAGKDLEGLAAKAKSAGQSLENIGGKISGVGTSITAVALPLAGLAAGAVKTSASFEDAFLKIENLVGRSREETEFFRNAVLELGPEVAIGPNELADALFSVTSAGAGAGEALDENNSALQILEASAKAAALGLGDTRTIALATTAATTAYGAENLSAAQAVETLVQTVKFGNLEASELAGTLGRVIPLAAQTGTTFQDVGAFIATFTRLGGDAAEATTALRGILGALVKPGTDAQKALAEVGLSAEGLKRQIREEGLAAALQTLQAATEGNEEALSRAIPNIRALTGVLATAGSQGEAFAQIAQDMSQQTDALGEGFARLQGTTSFTFAQFSAKAETAAIKFGDALAPALIKILDAADPVFDTVIKLANAFTELPPPVQTAAIGLAAFTAAMGPVLIIAGQAISGLGRLVQVFATVGPAVAKIPGLFGSATSALGGTTTALGGTVTAAGAATAGIAALTGVVAAQGTRAIADYGAELRGLDDPVRQAVSQVGLLQGAVSLAGDFFRFLATDAIDLAKAAFSTLLDVLGPVGEALRFVGEIGKVVFEEFAKGLSIIQDFVASGVEALINKSREADNAMRDQTVATAQLYQASQIAGRTITDQAEAERIVSEETQRLREANIQASDATAMLGEVATDTGGALDGPFAGGLKTGKDEADKFREAVDTLAESLSGAKLAGEVQVAVAAINELGGAGNITRSGMESLAPLIDELRLNSEKLPPPLREVALELSKIALFEGISDLDFEAPAISAEQWADEMNRLGDEFDDVTGNGIPGLQEGVPVIGGLKEQTFDLGSAMDGVNDILSEARGIMNLFGVDSDSALGKVIDGATKVFDTFNSVLGIVDKVAGAFGGLGGVLGGGGGGGILGGGGGILGSLGGLFGLGGGGGGAAAAGGAGAAGGLGGIFGSLGSAAGALFTNPFGLAVLGGIGAFFGGKALIGKLFGGRSADTVGEEAGRDLGVGISDELAKAVFESGKNLQLFLPEVFAEGKLSADRLAEEIGDIFSGITQGKISESDAIPALQESTQVLLQNFDQLGATGEAQLERVLRAADSTGLQFEASGEAASALAQRLVEAAQQGGDAWLNAQNEIGTTGRESLEFLRNAYGADLPASVLEAINSILGLNAAVDQTAGGAQAVNDKFAQLPSTAQESVAGIGAAFQEGSAAITEGLTPVSEKISNEIREAGSSTSEAVKASFSDTNAAIEAGLSQVAGTFAGPVTSSAERAAAAAARLADAAREAAKNAAQIDFPGGPGGPGSDVSAASGFEGVLGRDTRIQAHKGEFVSITPAAQTRRMDFVSAQDGFGPSPFSISTGGNTFVFDVNAAGAGPGAAADMRSVFQNDILPLFLEALRRNDQELRDEIRARTSQEAG